MYSDLVPRSSSLQPTGGSWRTQKAIRQLDGQASVEQHQLNLEADLGTRRLRTVVRVGTRALEAQSIVSMTERLIVEMEPGAIHGIGYLSSRLTIGLGQVIDKTIDEVTR